MQKKQYVKGLPIYQAGNGLVNLIIKSTKSFTREMRPLLGRMMLEESMRMMGNIIHANTSWDLKEKIERIDRVLRSVETIEMLYQSAYEFRLINKEIWANSIELTDSISNQAGGWRKSFERKLRESGGQSARR